MGTEASRGILTLLSFFKSSTVMKGSSSSNCLAWSTWAASARMQSCIRGRGTWGSLTVPDYIVSSVKLHDICTTPASARLQPLSFLVTPSSSPPGETTRTAPPRISLLSFGIESISSQITTYILIIVLNHRTSRFASAHDPRNASPRPHNENKHTKRLSRWGS